jgi:hypothetical protein
MIFRGAVDSLQTIFTSSKAVLVENVYPGRRAGKMAHVNVQHLAQELMTIEVLRACCSTTPVQKEEAVGLTRTSTKELCRSVGAAASRMCSEAGEHSVAVPIPLLH